MLLAGLQAIAVAALPAAALWMARSRDLLAHVDARALDYVEIGVFVWAVHTRLHARPAPEGEDLRRQRRYFAVEPAKTTRRQMSCLRSRRALFRAVAG
jgi:hypothetical protein